MAKKRWALALAIWLLAAILAILATLFIVRYFFEPKPEAPIPPTQQRPVEPPVSPPPEKVEPKKVDPKAGEKSKDGIKPKPEDTSQKAKARIDDGPGKVRICPNSTQTATIAADGTLLGHRPFADANASDLGSTPAGFNNGSCSQLHGEAKVALERLMEAARATDPAIADAMIGLSCFRSSKYQREVFCRKVADGYAVRARSSAPPGYSEHATGYAIDFGDRNNPSCNLNACFATTPVGAWLAQNAGQHGFVLSFPQGNAQGVTYEPWHWRFQGSGAAQTVFAGAN